MGRMLSQQGWWWVKFDSMWEAPSTVLGSVKAANVPEAQRHVGTGGSVRLTWGGRRKTQRRQYWSQALDEGFSGRRKVKGGSRVGTMQAVFRE